MKNRDKQTHQPYFFQLNQTPFTKTAPIIQPKAPIAMFIKNHLKEEVLYTNIQEGQVNYFSDQPFEIDHQHDGFELLFVLKGELYNHIEGRSIRYQAGDGCLMNRQIIHHEETLPGCSVLFINIQLDFMRDLLNNLTSTQLTQPIFQFFHKNIDSPRPQRNYLEFNQIELNAAAVFWSLLDFLQQELATTKIGATFFQKGLFLRILDNLQDNNEFKIYELSLDLSADDLLVARVCQWIEKQNGLTSREEIAQIFHYHPDYLNTLMKQKRQITLIKYAEQQKIKYIQQLIQQGKSNREIIKLTQFKSESHYYQFFKKHLGMTPQQYRKA